MRISTPGRINGYATLDALVAIIIFAIVAVGTIRVSGAIVTARSRRLSTLTELYSGNAEVQERIWSYYEFSSIK